MYHTAIRESIDKLSAIHRQLYDLAVEKTDVIKTGEIAQLQKITLSEQKLMQQLNKAEEQRMLTAKSYAKANHLPENEVTITAILESVKDEAEKNALEQAAIDLSKNILALREQEQLNQSLIRQSLKFINMSMEMMRPTLSSMNYGKQSKATKNAMFDSKA